MNREDSFSEIAHFRASLPSTISPGLARIQRALTAMPTAQSTHIITITGTNGKGSVGKALSALFAWAHVPTLWFNSPHIFSYQDRFQYNNTPVTASALHQAFLLCRDVARTEMLTIFEFDFLLAYSLLVVQQPRVAILEVGMGGRLDAVNALDTDCAIITSIALDHQAFLGSTSVAIAREKAGIIRAHKPAILSAQAAFYVLQAVAGSDMADAKYSICGIDFTIDKSADGWCYTHKHYSRRANLPVPELLIQNWALALAAFDVVGHAINCAITNEDVRTLVRVTQLPGRFDCIAQAPYVICDVAANEQAVVLLARKLRTFCKQHNIKRVYALVGLLKDKASPALMAPLINMVDSWYIASVVCDEFPDRSEKAVRVREQLDIDATVCDDVAACKRVLQDALQPNTLLVCFGSFYLLPDCYRLFADVPTTA